MDQPAVIQHWLIARDLMDDGEENGSVSRQPKETRTGSDGKTYTVDTYADERGCVFVENWVIDLMFHAYAGGDQTDVYDVVSDPNAPNMRQYGYDFLMDQLDDDGPPGCDATDSPSVQADSAVAVAPQVPTRPTPATGGGLTLVGMVTLGVALGTGRR